MKLDIFGLARMQLGFDSSLPDSRLPPAYIAELEKHVQSNPNDTNFFLETQPREGYGIVLCLDEGCSSASIDLTPRLTAVDGGIQDGFGSLSAYRHHCDVYPGHGPSKTLHVMPENPTQSTSATASSYKTPAPKDSATATAVGQRATTTTIIKPEPVASIIPHKRPSDQGIKCEPFDDLPTPSTPKRLKREPSLKSPLTTSNFINSPSSSNKMIRLTSSTSVAPPPATARDTANIGYLISKAEFEIKRKRYFLHALQRKPKPSRANLRKMQIYQTQIVALEREIIRLRDSLPGTSTAPSTADLLRRQQNGLLDGFKMEGEEVKPFTVNMNLSHHPIAGPSSGKIESHPDNLPSHYNSTVKSQYRIEKEDDIDYDTDAELGEWLAPGPIMPMIYGPPNRDAAIGDFQHQDRDTFGPQANVDDIDQFLRAAGNSAQFDSNASVGKALEKLGLGSQYQLLPGMEVALMAHQLIGVAWMLDKETGVMKGGCLADDMGLGKTVQMIALMCMNPPTDRVMKTTLIIAPTALLDQWKLELEVKSRMGWKVCIYHGSSKPKTKKALLEYDIVITTYGTMAMEWPDYEETERREKKAKKAAKKKDNFIASDSDSDGIRVGKSNKFKGRKTAGLLFQAEFYRVLLDEAQMIRNRRTRTSRAATSLSAQHRWCLTGTPIVNSLVDAYAYFRFLQVRPWYDWKEFNGRVGSDEKKNPKSASMRLQGIFSTMLLRRLKDSQLDGKKLIELPSKTVDIDRLEFSDEERTIYEMVEAKSQVQFNRYLKAGTVLKNYHHVLVMLLRLRQICSHPCLIQENAENAAFVDSRNFKDLTPERATERTRARRVVGQAFVDKIQKKLFDIAIKKRDEGGGVDIFMAGLEEEEEEDPDSICPICFDVFAEPRITSCGHTFCRECIGNVMNLPMPDETQGARPDERPCPSCRTFVSPEAIFDRDAFEPSAAALNPPSDDCSKDLDVDMSDADTPIRGSKFSGERGEPILIDSDDEGKRIPVKRTRLQRAVAQKKPRYTHDESDDDDDDDDGMSDFIVESDADEEKKNARRASRKRSKRRKTVIYDSDDECEDEIEKEVLCGVKSRDKGKGRALPVVSDRQHEATTAIAVIPTMDRFLPSTKMKFMMEHVEKLMDEKPDEKIIVISQWTSCLALISNYLAEKSIAHVKYQGDMNRAKRDAAIRLFMHKEKARVMLMSQKCGGVGLNLTRANNVISMDLGWSPAVENQAFDRAHRLGQTRSVLVKRLVIENTVEDRIMALQERKQNLADGSLGEGNNKKLGRLNVTQLAALFGLDARGRNLNHD